MTAPLSAALQRPSRPGTASGSCSSTLASSAGSLKVTLMTETLSRGFSRWTFSSSLASSSRVGGLSPVWKPKAVASCCAHLVVVAVALVLDRLFDVDRVDEAEAAVEVEPGHDAEGDVVSDVLRGTGSCRSLIASSGRPHAKNAPSPMAATKPVFTRQPRSMTGSAQTSAQTTPSANVTMTQKAVVVSGEPRRRARRSRGGPRTTSDAAWRSTPSSRKRRPGSPRAVLEDLLDHRYFLSAGAGSSLLLRSCLRRRARRSRSAASCTLTPGASRA